MKSTRGIRNNNPLNIKIGNDWQGEVPNTDGVFEQFESMEYGLRAAFIILRKYITKYGRNSIADIVHSWSPDGEAIERAYMLCVQSFANIPVNQEVSYWDKETMCLIVQGMAYMENGCRIDIDIIRRGYEMANS